MVSSSSTARSEMVGWMAGSKLDEMAGGLWVAWCLGERGGFFGYLW